jgi:hypothetical protein
MAEATRLKMWHPGHLQWHHPSTKFHENPPIGSEVISGGHTDRQAGDFISLLPFLESRLKSVQKIEPRGPVRSQFMVSKEMFGNHCSVWCRQFKASRKEVTGNCNNVKGELLYSSGDGSKHTVKFSWTCNKCLNN